jgi:hypothetical protein
VGLLLLAGVVATMARPDVRAQFASPSPGTVATPRSLAATPETSVIAIATAIPADEGIAGRIGGQQAAAQATIAAFATREAVQATRIAQLQDALVAAQVTTTALAVVAANTVLDPDRQTVTIQTDLAGMLADDPDALADARSALGRELSRFPLGCRAGFMLISGKAPTIDQGVTLAERTDTILRQFWPDIFNSGTGAEHFALPNEQPAGEVGIDIFFYSGCQPIQ